MERRKRLVSRKALQSNSPLKITSVLKTKKGLVAKKSLQPRSKKTKKLYKERSKFVERFLKEHPKCMAYWDDNCFERSVDVHEILPRGVGGKILSEDESEFMAVCRYCHVMITENPKEANRRGYRKWSWE